jgi:hypothetical protein
MGKNDGLVNTHTDKFRVSEKRTITCNCGYQISGQKRDVNLKIKLHQKVSKKNKI